MKNEIKRILDLVEQGKITTADGTRLIKAINERVNDEHNIYSGEKPHWLKVVVHSKSGRKHENVNIKIPLFIMKAALKIGEKFTFAIPEHARHKMDEHGINISEIMESNELIKLVDNVSSHGKYTLVDIDDKDETVKITIE